MSLHSQFSTQEIVWAKVSPLTWMPAKIHKVVQSSGRPLYIVNFYHHREEEPTEQCSSHIDQQSLLAFQEGLNFLPQDQANDRNFKKSYQKARKEWEKYNILMSSIQIQKETASEPLSFLNCYQFQQSASWDNRISINSQRDNVQTKENPSFSQTAETNLSRLYQIDETNVLDLIGSATFQQLKKSKGYANRREVSALQLKFKDALLSKYKLSLIPKMQDKVDRTSRFTGKKKIIKRNQQQFKSQLVKRLKRIVKKALSIQGQQLRNAVTQLFDSLSLSSIKGLRQKGFYSKVAKYVEGAKICRSNSYKQTVPQKLQEGLYSPLDIFNI